MVAMLFCLKCGFAVLQYWAIPQSQWIEEANKAKAKQLEQLKEVNEQLQKVKPAADKTKQAARIVGKLFKRCMRSKEDPLLRIADRRRYSREVDDVMNYHRIAWYQRPIPKDWRTKEEKIAREVNLSLNSGFFCLSVLAASIHVAQ